METRNTKQKRIVTDVLESAECPLTVHEVLARGQKSVPSLSLATVYREIGRLSAAEAIRTVSIPGDPIRYETSAHHHHHFKCTSCDKVYELEGCTKALAKLVPKGFKPQMHDLTFYGLCRVCS